MPTKPKVNLDEAIPSSEYARGTLSQQVNDLVSSVGYISAWLHPTERTDRAESSTIRMKRLGDGTVPTEREHSLVVMSSVVPSAFVTIRSKRESVTRLANYAPTAVDVADKVMVGM
ncbi:hypothetical protein FRC14_006002 [Serendipita sp. 396]|nr:hypothetical protein FRC14_006002 [Serendipita sp. 396]KAG8779086.1 hypothetical protein FRC15_010383 [Serendipita sp. 397]KAG8865082.1 hypothetical protein FRC20_009897 [Serendipita sp. 405]